MERLEASRGTEYAMKQPAKPKPNLSHSKHTQLIIANTK